MHGTYLRTCRKDRTPRNLGDVFFSMFLNRLGGIDAVVDQDGFRRVVRPSHGDDLAHVTARCFGE